MRTNWHDGPITHATLRVCGVAMLALCSLICVRLAALAHGHAGAEPASVYLLVLAGFASLASGGALLFYGHHLFDRVGVSPRWATRRQMRDE